jgi:hypothetical protein
MKRKKKKEKVTVTKTGGTDGEPSTFVPGHVTTRYKCSVTFVPDAL